MGSITAQLMFGGSDMYHGGIRPRAVVWLRENDIPALVIEGVGGLEPEAGPPSERIVWYPSRVEHILEEAILLGAVHGYPTGDLAESRRPQACPVALSCSDFRADWALEWDPEFRVS